MPPPLRIFVSYRRDDTGGHAGRLYDALAAHFGAENVFIDIDTIDLGTDFADVIHRAVTSCDAVIAIIGRAWVQAADVEGRRRLEDPDDFVRLELESALERDMFVIPAIVQGASVPGSEELPPGLAPLARRQGVELRDVAWHDDVGRLIRRLERLAAELAEAEAPVEPAPAPAVPQPPAAAPPPPARRRRVWLIAGIVLGIAAIAGIVAAVALTRGGGSDDSSGTTTGPPLGATADERRLLALIPPVTRHSCQRIDYGEESAQLSLECSGARLAVGYHLFADAASMNAWYVVSREEEAIEPGTGQCVPGAFRGEGPYTLAGATVGRRFCFVDSEDLPELFWTDSRAPVGAQANIYEGTGPAAVRSLLRQWECCLRLQPQ